MECQQCKNKCPPSANFCGQCGSALIHQAPAAHDTMPCPKCGKSIIPQWTYTGRKFALSVSNVGIESHGKSRLCPLCGTDIDAYFHEQELAAMTPSQRTQAEYESPAFLARLFIIIAIGIAAIAWAVAKSQ